ncbi:MAG: NTPase KAP [Methylococcales bacterium]|nr:NTPase KAP [Methylococcales bacterium]
MTTEVNDQTALPTPLHMPEVDITEDQWPCGNDLLERHKEIENLSPVLLNAQTPLAFAIDAPWGAGKTTFIKLWQAYLNKQGYKSIHLNVWESDFSEDPLLPLLSAIDEWVKGGDDDSAAKKSWNKAKKIVPGLLKGLTVASVKASTLGILELDKEYEKVASNLTGEIAGDLVEQFTAKKEALEQFKQLIGKVIKALPDEQLNLIIFIDEIDRCRPTYAIELLERVKHLFDIDRLVFVLAVNREQLSKSLQGVYGSSFDGVNYLKRFIDMNYQLKITDQKSYSQSLLQQQDISKYYATRKDGDQLRILQDTLGTLFKRFGYSLRDINQTITRLRLILRSIPFDDKIDTPVLSLLLILQEVNRDLFNDFKHDPSVVNEVVECLIGMPSNHEKLPERYGWLGAWLVAAASQDRENNQKHLLDEWKNILNNMQESDQNRGEIERLIKSAPEIPLYDRVNILQLAFDRIELMAQIEITA